MSSEQATSFDDRFTPEINHARPQANVSSWSPAQRHDSAPIVNVRHRPSTRLRFADVKMWFLALWHHGLRRSATRRRLAARQNQACKTNRACRRRKPARQSAGRNDAVPLNQREGHGEACWVFIRRPDMRSPSSDAGSRNH
jgi:hypothetical protein